MNRKENILRTITYSDLFDFPLKLKEVHKYYNSPEGISKEKLKELLDSHPELSHLDGYYFLKGKEALVLKRAMREEESQKKIIKAQRWAKILSVLPSVKMIALSGSLALSNARHDDDIDLFIITSNNTVWITRLFVNLMLVFARQKRSKHDRVAPNKICPNMLIAQRAMTIPEHARTLYTAREIAQLKPLISKNHTYEELLSKNHWIKEYLGNIKIKPSELSENNNQKWSGVTSAIDTALFKAQRKYMQNITNEIVKKDIAKFHPRKTGEYIMFLFDKRMSMQKEKMTTFASPSSINVIRIKN